jgi:hypothetical protein
MVLEIESNNKRDKNYINCTETIRHNWSLSFKMQDDPNFPKDEHHLSICYDPLFSNRDNISDTCNEFLFVEFDNKWLLSMRTISALLIKYMRDMNRCLKKQDRIMDL